VVGVGVPGHQPDAGLLPGPGRDQRDTCSRRGLEPKAAADVLWLLIDPSQYRRLVTERRWSHRAFQRWHADAMTRLLLA